MSIEFMSAPSPATQSDIVALEQDLGFQLPESYRRFLAERGGGRPRPNHSVAPEARSVGVGVIEFFPVGELHSRRHHFSGRVPDHLLAIADDPCGNLVCLAIKGEDVGVVLFWDHELEAEADEPPTDRNLTRIADDFSQFVDSLMPYESSGMERPTKVLSAWIDQDFLARLRISEPEVFDSPRTHRHSSPD